MEKWRATFGLGVFRYASELALWWVNTLKNFDSHVRPFTHVETAALGM